jgi:hypothetical protein
VQGAAVHHPLHLHAAWRWEAAPSMGPLLESACRSGACPLARRRPRSSRRQLEPQAQHPSQRTAHAAAAPRLHDDQAAAVVRRHGLVQLVREEGLPLKGHVAVQVGGGAAQQGDRNLPGGLGQGGNGTRGCNTQKKASLLHFQSGGKLGDARELGSWVMRRPAERPEAAAVQLLHTPRTTAARDSQAAAGAPCRAWCSCSACRPFREGQQMCPALRE